MERRDSESSGDRERSTPRRSDSDGPTATDESIPGPVADLHRTAGNQAIQGRLAPGNSRETLPVSHPDGPAEREARRVADRVLRRTADSDGPRTAGPGDDGAAGADTAAQPGSDGAPGITDALGRGNPLPASIRSFFEPRFGADFSAVRVHTGHDADRAARSLDARAFTVGSDIAFRRGEYDPSSSDGKRLLAHELVHVRQQGDAVRRQDASTDTTTTAPSDTSSTATPDTSTTATPSDTPATATPDTTNTAASDAAETAAEAAASETEESAEETAKSVARKEWDNHPSIHAHFGNSFQEYKLLRKEYKAQEGITNAARYISENIEHPAPTFFGTRIVGGIHTDLVGPLQTVEQTLQSEMDVDPNINRMTGFVPRLQRNDPNISNHALGRAVDINRGENPHIQDFHDDAIQLIWAVTGVHLGRNQSLTALANASDEFQTHYDDQWKTDLESRIEELRSAKEGEEDLTERIRQHRIEAALGGDRVVDPSYPVASLEGYEEILDAAENAAVVERHNMADQGFMNLDLALVRAFQNAGFEWGGSWEHEKDFMHFEIDA